MAEADREYIYVFLYICHVVKHVNNIIPSVR